MGPEMKISQARLVLQGGAQYIAPLQNRGEIRALLIADRWSPVASL
jgi:hypothetical protein